MRKATLLIISAVLVVTLLASGVQLAPSHAQGGPPGKDFPVALEIVGKIQSISVKQLTLADGTAIQINKQTTGLSPALKPGVTVTVTVQVDDEDFVALSIVLGEVIVTPSATRAATSVATKAATEKGKGKTDDKGQVKGNSDDNDDDNDDEREDNGNGKGKGNDDNDDEREGNGKGKDKVNDKQLAACLKNTKHPVATRLAGVFGVPYLDIMTWHCKHKGFGEITRAYLLWKKTGMSVAQLFASRESGKGWGEIIKDSGLDPEDLAPGGVIRGKRGQGGKD